MSASALPVRLALEIVTPEGLLLRDEVDEVIAPGRDGYFGVLPGHTPFLSTLGMGEITVRNGAERLYFTCFWGFAEVLPDRVNILAEVCERADAIDPSRAEAAKARAESALKAVKDEAGYQEARTAYVKAVTRLAVAKQRRP
jgi:F-type H+-transporting ATPase subunit epsilon